MFTHEDAINFVLIYQVSVGTLCARSLLLVHFSSQTLGHAPARPSHDFAKPSWRFKMPKRSEEIAPALEQVCRSKRNTSLDYSDYSLRKRQLFFQACKLRRAIRCPYFGKSCLACHVAVVYRLALHGGSGGFFGAIKRLFGWLHISTCVLRGHRRGINHFSPEVVPAVVFPLCFHIFHLRVF